MVKYPKSILVSAVISIGLLIVFFFIQWWKADLLALPAQYLLLALAPLLIGVLMSGYIIEVKAGNVGITLAEEALESSEQIPDSGKSAGNLQPISTESWQNDRAKENQRTRGYMLAHVYKPSSERSQLFDISIFVVRH